MGSLGHGVSAFVRRRVFACLAVAALLSAQAGSGLAAETAPPATWPTAAWPTASPAAHGWDTAKLAEILLTIRDSGAPLHSLTLVQGGDVILDAVFFPYDGSTVHQLASVTKSITPTLVEMAAEEGLLSLDDPVLSFFPDREIAARDARKERITLRHLASMTSGLACTADGDERTLQQMKASPDWVQFALDLPMVAEPGTSFSYCSPGMHLLSAALQEATDMTEEAFAREHLFEPLGITDLLWETDPQGYTRGWADLYLKPLDSAKLGYLWLQGGNWDGRQLVSRAWIEDSIRVQAQTGGGDDYGYGWWLPRTTETGEYRAAGRGGQSIGVHPALDAIVVTTAGGIESAQVTDLLAPALIAPGSVLPPDPAGDAALAEAVAAVAEPPEPHPLRPLPATAIKVSGVTWAFEPNAKDFATARLDFTPGSAEAAVEVTFSTDEPTRAGAVGLDGVLRMSPGTGGLRWGFRGEWTDENTFQVEFDQIARFESFVLTFRFDGDHVTLEGRERSHEIGFTATGSRLP